MINDVFMLFYYIISGCNLFKEVGLVINNLLDMFKKFRYDILVINFGCSLFEEVGWLIIFIMGKLKKKIFILLILKSG